MDTQKFCLKWNNFQNSVTSVFENLRKGGELVDITLCCEGHKIKAHRMMLSACSPFFRDLFKENPCQHPVFFLKDTSYPDLAAVVEFVYKGEVNVAQSQLGSFLKTAEMLQVRGLTGDDEEDAAQHRIQTPKSEPRNPSRPLSTTPASHPHTSRPAPSDASPQLLSSSAGRSSLPSPQVRSRPAAEQRVASPPGKRRRLSDDASPAALSDPAAAASGSVPAVSSGSGAHATPPEASDAASPSPDLRPRLNSTDASADAPSSSSAALQSETSAARAPHLPPPPTLPQQYPAHTLPAPPPPPPPHHQQQQEDYANIKVEKVDLVDDDDSLEATFQQVSSMEAAQFEGSDHSASSQDMAGLLSQGIGDLSAMSGPSEDGSSQGPEPGLAAVGRCYRCQLCSRQYTNSRSLDHHMHVHRGSTTCLVCGSVYGRVGTLRHHVLTRHPEAAHVLVQMLPTRGGHAATEGGVDPRRPALPPPLG